MLNKVKIGLGIATVGMGLALVPAITPASATVSRVSAVSGVRVTNEYGRSERPGLTTTQRPDNGSSRN